MGGCQNYGPVLGALNIRCRIVVGIQKRDHTFDNNPPGTLISDDMGLNIRANHNISVRRKNSNFIPPNILLGSPLIGDEVHNK